VRARRRAFLALAAGLLATGPLHAQTWPERPVTIVLPLQVGSASDIAVRIFAERLSEELKGSFVVENVPGAAGLIGAERLARAKPDGYTLAALNNSILTILPNIQKDKVTFNPLADFTPVHGIANIPTLLGVSETLPVKNVRDLVALAQGKPGQLNYATGGPGSPQHLATEMFMAMTATKMTQVPYKGATAAAAGLAGGQVDVMFISHSIALPFLPTGKVRAIAFAGPKRSAAFPDLPTVAESGVPGFDYSSWIALFAPKGTPADVVSRLQAASAKVLAAPDMKERLAKSGLELWATPPAALPGVIREDLDRWAKVAREANIKAE
jgi:tripartite-type tricarboxylate transporter receptor subunit TctC